VAAKKENIICKGKDNVIQKTVRKSWTTITFKAIYHLSDTMNITENTREVWKLV